MDTLLGRSWILPVIVACAMAMSCKDSSRSSKGAQPASGPTTQVQLSVDGKDPVAVAVGGTATAVPLVVLLGHSVPPMRTWYEIDVHHATSSLEVVMETYKDYDLMAYRDEQGGLRAGLFPPGAGSSARPLKEVVGLDRIEVWTKKPPAREEP